MRFLLLQSVCLHEWVTMSRELCDWVSGFRIHANLHFFMRVAKCVLHRFHLRQQCWIVLFHMPQRNLPLESKPELHQLMWAQESDTA